MTLSLTHESWRNRVMFCEADRLERFQSYDNRVRSYIGPAHAVAEGWQNEGDYNPINHTYHAVSTWLPQVAGGVPRYKVGSGIEAARDDAARVEPALNRIARQSDERELNEQLLVDFWLDYCVTLTSQEPRPGFSDLDDPPYTPTETRVPPWDFLYDQEQYYYKRWRWTGHRVVRDKEDVIAQAEANPDEGWNVDVIRSMPARMVKKPWEARLGEVSPQREDRHQVEYYEVYCPEVTAQDLRDQGFDIPATDDDGREWNAKSGYHGAMFYVTKSADTGDKRDATDQTADSGDWIRKPHMWWGPRGGPYTYLNAYFVPNDCIGLSPDIATKAQQEAANDMARACLRAVDRQKEVTAVAADGDVEDLVTAEDGTMVPLRGMGDENLAQKIQTIKMGGIYSELLLSAQWTAQLLDEASGMGAPQRGELQGGDPTATEVAVASSSSSAKMAFLSLKFREFRAECARKRAWYLLKDERSVVLLGEDEGGGIFVGGQSEARALKRAADVDPAIKPQVEQAIMQATGERQSFDAIIAALEREEAKQEKHDLGEDEIDRLDLTIEPYSMERTDDGIQQMRLQQMAEIVPTLAEMFAQFPFLEADNIMRQVGDWTNIPGLEQFVNMEKLAAFQQMTMGAQFATEETQPPMPRLSRDKPKSVGTPGQRTGAVAGAGSTVQ